MDDVVDEVSDASLARVKLAWWRNEVSELYAGHPHHPVALALQPIIALYGLPQAELQEIIDGMEMDLGTTRYLDFAALERYCYKVAGVVGLLSAEIFGYTGATTRGYAKDLGIAFQLTNIIRDVGEDARRGRIYLPQDEMARFGVTAGEILRCQETAGFSALMAFQVERARSWYARAMAQLPPRIARPSGRESRWRRFTAPCSNEIARDGYHVLDRRTSLTPLRKLWIAWRAH